MTGWTQFTVRFEDEQHADALREGVAGGDLFGECRASYNETLGPIARVRLAGHHNNHDTAVRLLGGAGPFDLALVADFNDTGDSGKITVYNGNLNVLTRAPCPSGHRLSFEVTIGGLTETGVRAGNDFSLEQQYGESEKEMVSLEEIERVSEEALEMMKTHARVEAEEHR